MIRLQSRFVLRFLILILFFGFAGLAHAVSVCKEGPPKCQETTIAGALYKSQYNGQSVIVGPGIYMENDLWIGNTGQGGYRALVSESPGSPELTVIDATGSGNPVIGRLYGNMVRGFTLRGGNGGIVMYGGDVVLQDLIIEDNNKDSGPGGGVTSGGGSPSLTIINCTIRRNRAPGGGGGIYANGPLTITGSSIEANEAYGDTGGRANGGGIHARPFNTLLIKNSSITGNTATGSRQNMGAGIWTYRETTLVNVIVTNNIAYQGQYSAYGGGIEKSKSTGSGPYLRVYGGTIAGNEADIGGGLNIGNSSRLVLSGGAIVDNIARDGIAGTSGGGVHCNGTKSIESLVGTVNGNTPGELAGCSDADPPLGTTRTVADNKKSGSSADPVNTFTGELFQQYPADINLGGPMPLRFSRYYSSGLKQAGIFANMGDNWRHNFDWRMSVIGTTIHIVDPQGRTVQFVKNVSNWDLAGKQDIAYQLVENIGNYSLLDPRNQHMYTFSDVGQLTAIDDGRGNVHSLVYTGGLLTQVSDGLGRTLGFSYDAGGHLTGVDDGLGRFVSFSYSSAELSAVMDLNGNTTLYTYSTSLSNRGLLSTVVRPEGNAPFEHWYRSGDLKTVSEFDSSGNETSFSYVNASTTTVTDPLGNVRTHTHTSSGELSNNQDQAGQSLQIGYDAAGRRNAMTDKSGNVVGNSYDPISGQLTTLTLPGGDSINFTYAPRVVGGVTYYDQTGVSYPDGSSETFTYDASGNLISYTDQLLNTRTLAYNARGQRTQKTNKLGGVYTYTYNTDGTFATRTDPFGNTTTFGYDAYKRLTGVTYADGNSRSYTWDTKDRLTSETDERGNTTTMIYDGNDRVVSATNALGSSTSFSYDGNDRLVSADDALGTLFSTGYDVLGRVETTTDGNGNAATMGYDNRGNLTSITDMLGNAWSAGYDADGFIISTSDPLNNTLTFSRNARHQVTRRTSPLGYNNDIAYDLMGRVVSTTDPLGNVTQYSYDANGRVTGVTLADGSGTSYTRNVLGQVTTLTDPNGNNWNRAYDTAGRKTSVTDPLGQTTTFAYDSSNRPQLVTLPGALGSANFTYDAAGNATQILYSDGTNLAFSYDANGRATAANGIALTFDIRGQVTDSNGIVNSYDAGGRLTSTRLAAGKTVTYSYDANNQLIQVDDWAGGTVTFSYDAAGNVISINRPTANGVNTGYSYDNDNRLTGIVESGVSSIDLTRNGKGQVTVATRNVPQPPPGSGLSSHTASFDAAAQLIGNSYDSLGRLTASGADSFVWDLASRLTSYTVAGTTVSNSYDALGRRTSRAGAVTSSYVWNDALDLPSVSIEKRSAVDFRYFVHTPAGQLLYAIDATSGARSFYHYDEMGNTIFITDDAGTVIGSYAYSPFGELIASTGALDNPFTWQGEFGVMDEKNGLYYLRARYYDSIRGRFISRDPKQRITPLAANPYQYAMMNPLLFIDPRGEQSETGNFEDSMTDTVIGNATNSVSYSTLIVGVVDNKTTPQVITKGPLTVLKGTSLRKAVADALWDPPKDTFKLTKLNGGNNLDRLGGAADIVSAGATAYKTAERLNKVHENGQKARLTALEGQALQLDEVVRLLEKGRISSAMADKLATDIVRRFEEENSGSLVRELINTKIEALVGFKDTLTGLAGPIGEAADGFLGFLGFGNPESE